MSAQQEDRTGIESGRRRRRRAWLWGIAFVLAIVTITPSYVRAYRVGGSSDAPTYLRTDLVLVNKGAYDLRLPYTDIVLFGHADPEPGEVVLYRVPGEQHTVFKRIVAGPGDVVEMRANRLIVNEQALEYEPLDPKHYADISEEHGLGSLVELEKGLGRDHTISHSGSSTRAGSFDPVTVPPGHYFMIGDNRDNSLDSRMYGPVPRDSIIGRLGRPFWRE